LGHRLVVAHSAIGGIILQPLGGNVELGCMPRIVLIKPSSSAAQKLDLP
jgi:hypothetical protein